MDLRVGTPLRTGGPARAGRGAAAGSVPADAVRAQLDRLLGSTVFRYSERLSRFLKFVVEQALAGETDRLKESVLAIEIFDRESTYDSRVDSVVRVEARRLREKLDKYYAGEGIDDPILIELPRGTYVPVITWRPGPAPEERRFGTPAQLRYGAIALCLAALVLVTVALTRWAGSGDLLVPSFQRLTSDPGLTFQPALSIGGKLIAYASDRGGSGTLDIWLQQGPRGVPVRLTDDPGDELEPAFSPDGAVVAYRQEGEPDGIYTVPALGGTSTLLARGGYRPRFSPDGRRLAYWTGERTFRAARLFVMPAEGGEPVQVQPGFAYAAYPVWSPNGRYIVFVGVREKPAGEPNLDDWDWWVAPADGGPAVRTGARNALERRGLRAPEATWYHRWIVPYGWTSSGQIVFSARSGAQTNIWRLAISSRDLQASGAPEQLTFGAGRQDYPAVAADGSLAFTALTLKSDIWSIPAGPEAAQARAPAIRLTGGPADSNRPSVSADGKRLAFISNRTGADQVWVKDLATGEEMALTATPEEKDAVAISRDGARVAFGHSPPVRQAIFSLPFSGGEASLLCSDCGLPRAWLPNGAGLLFQRRAGEESQIALLDSSGRQETLVSAKDSSLFSPSVSPDGRWLVLIVRTPPNDHRVTVVPLRAGKAADRAEWIAVTEPGAWVDKPRWSASGDTIYYVSDSDGFVCIWGRRFDPAAKKPTAEPHAVAHFHSARSSLGSVYGRDLSAAENRLVFNLGEASGNIWLAPAGP
jgi:eukaryotic-like serine/threonine-protein kinase